MTPDERRRVLGDDIIQHIQDQVDAAPPPPPHLIAELRRIFARPAPAPPVRRPAPVRRAA